MNRQYAEQLAQSGITVGKIKQMLVNAYDAGAADDKRSRMNANLTRAQAYNIFWQAWKDDTDERVINPRMFGDWYGARNAIIEFGEFGDFPKQEKRPKYEPNLILGTEPINPHLEEQ